MSFKERDGLAGTQATPDEIDLARDFPYIQPESEEGKLVLELDAARHKPGQDTEIVDDRRHQLIGLRDYHAGLLSWLKVSPKHATPEDFSTAANYSRANVLRDPRFEDMHTNLVVAAAVATYTSFVEPRPSVS